MVRGRPMDKPPGPTAAPPPAPAPAPASGPTSRPRRLPSPPAGPPIWTDAFAPHYNNTNNTTTTTTTTTPFLPDLGDWAFDAGVKQPYQDASSALLPEVVFHDVEALDSESLANTGWAGYRRAAGPARAWSTASFETQTSSSAGGLLSPVQTEASVRSSRSPGPGPSPLGPGTTTTTSTTTTNTTTPTSTTNLPCLGPQCQLTFPTEADLKSHVSSAHTHSCNWSDCHEPSFSSRDGLAWHVKADHLLVCPFPGCVETGLESGRAVRSHLAVAHVNAQGEAGGGASCVQEWELATAENGGHHGDKAKKQRPPALNVASQDVLSATQAKQKHQSHLRAVLEKRHNKKTTTNNNNNKPADSPSDLVRVKASRLVDAASFPLVFEHCILPFLSEFLPKWTGPYHVVSVTRGRAPNSRRICVTARRQLSRARKVTLARHVQDLLPEGMRRLVSFVFARGRVERVMAAAWARGLDAAHMDDICEPRNPYFFRQPRMGDSIGVRGNGGSVGPGTATLGPALVVGGSSFWLGNFHPFVEAYQNMECVSVEHPSSQDRGRCLEAGHDAMAHEEAGFRLGNIEATSGLTLKTTRVSHDAYWDECDKEPPLVVTDWSLISARASAHANLLRRFPCETQPLARDTPVTSTGAIQPGAYVTSTGRTSGHQRGQVCEIPAYVSGSENGTQKATREWFVEEPAWADDEEGWIRGGIGVEGDSGAAVVDAASNALIGQLWGRNRYWGPGPRLTFFTPMADILDDIQEKCGQAARPRLPQLRDEDDCFPLYPSCRQCYDMRTYLDSRRSSRMSLQSMVMAMGDGHGDHDLTSIEADSELATPRDYHRYVGVEEAGSSFPPSSATCPGTPAIAADIRSPYATTLDNDDLYETHVVSGESHKRGPAATWAAAAAAAERYKRQRVDS